MGKRTNLEFKVKKFLSMNELSIEETVENQSAKQELDRIYDHTADGFIYCAQRHYGTKRVKKLQNISCL